MSMQWNSPLSWYHPASDWFEDGIGPYGVGEFSTTMEGLSALTSAWSEACGAFSRLGMLVYSVRSANGGGNDG